MYLRKKKISCLQYQARQIYYVPFLKCNINNNLQNLYWTIMVSLLNSTLGHYQNTLYSKFLDGWEVDRPLLSKGGSAIE